MTDRPRAERRKGMTVIFDRQAGYVSNDLTIDDMVALIEELVVLWRVATLCEGKIPRSSS